MNIAAALRAFRLSHGYSQRELAEGAGVSQALWSLIERGRSPLPLEAYSRLVERFGAEIPALSPKSSPVDVLKSLAAAWDAYDRCRLTLSQVVRKLVEASTFLRPYQRRLEDVLSTGTEKGLIDSLIGAGAIDQFQRAIPPAKEELAAFADMPRDSVLNDESLRSLQRLIAIVGRLAPEDVELVTNLAERLASKPDE